MPTPLFSAQFMIIREWIFLSGKGKKAGGWGGGVATFIRKSRF